MSTQHLFLLVMPLLVCGLASCSGGADGELVAEWDVAALTGGALAELDSDGDGFVFGDEFAASPGLARSLSNIDFDGDGRVSQAELAERFAAYQSAGSQVASYECQISYRGRPLAGADVKFVPEKYLVDVLPTASGTTDQEGVCRPTSEGLESGIFMGVYRVQINSGDVKLPAKYNAESQLGAEVVGAALTRDGNLPAFELR